MGGLTEPGWWARYCCWYSCWCVCREWSPGTPYLSVSFFLPCRSGTKWRSGVGDGGDNDGGGDYGGSSGGGGGSSDVDVAARGVLRPRRESSILPGAVVPAHTAESACAPPHPRVPPRSRHTGCSENRWSCHHYQCRFYVCTIYPVRFWNRKYRKWERLFTARPPRTRRAPRMIYDRTYRHVHNVRMDFVADSIRVSTGTKIHTVPPGLDAWSDESDGGFDRVLCKSCANVWWILLYSVFTELGLLNVSGDAWLRYPYSFVY